MPPVKPPEPCLGRVRRVVLLPPGVGRALHFDGDGVELGNGWFDVTARLAMADPDDWLPPLTWAPVVADNMRFPRDQRGWRDADRAFPDQLLCDGRRNPMRELLPGSIMRDSATVGDAVPAYWLYAGGVWWALEAIELPAPRPDNSGTPGTPAEQIADPDPAPQ